MKKKIFIVLVVLAGFFLLTGCNRDSEIVSYNMSKEADAFRVKRRIIFINLRTNDYIFEMTGLCSINVDSDGDLDVICKVGEDKYQKHFLHLTNEVTYTVEQLDYNEVSKYDYEIVFKPQSIIPIKIETEIGNEVIK